MSRAISKFSYQKKWDLKKSEKDQIFLKRAKVGQDSVLEPFSLKEEVRDGIIDRYGVYKLKRERNDEAGDRLEDHDLYEEDAWLQTLE